MKTCVQTVPNKMDMCIVNTRSHLSINKQISESGDLKLMRSDGKWEKWTCHRCLSDMGSSKIYYLANLTAPWCAVYLRTCEMTNLWEEKPEKHVPFKRWEDTLYTNTK